MPPPLSFGALAPPPTSSPSGSGFYHPYASPSVAVSDFGASPFGLQESHLDPSFLPNTARHIRICDPPLPYPIDRRHGAAYGTPLLHVSIPDVPIPDDTMSPDSACSTLSMESFAEERESGGRNVHTTRYRHKSSMRDERGYGGLGLTGVGPTRTVPTARRLKTGKTPSRDPRKRYSEHSLKIYDDVRALGGDESVPSYMMFFVIRADTVRHWKNKPKFYMSPLLEEALRESGYQGDMCDYFARVSRAHFNHHNPAGLTFGSGSSTASQLFSPFAPADQI
ncbi:hypothetical protein EUX98_g5177 [Antrodiella citrinella]|uniref:Uncharacterized protein n=1 Tax=Antrodiella citrinella TaxID=2447956 RepID=A0A4S4MUL5_9APHY|nr:hypothetical protein EUX98_g5177 [Antrodiella citrinella]